MVNFLYLNTYPQHTSKFTLLYILNDHIRLLSLITDRDQPGILEWHKSFGKFQVCFPLNNEFQFAGMLQDFLFYASLSFWGDRDPVRLFQPILIERSIGLYRNEILQLLSDTDDLDQVIKKRFPAGNDQKIRFYPLFLQYLPDL